MNNTLYGFTDIELVSDTITLVPLKECHGEALVSLSERDQLSTLWFTQIPDNTTIDSYMALAQMQKQQGEALPFAVIENSTSTVIGTTRICHADFANRRFEIGYTWYGKSYQRTSVNTECKLLLLSYLFDKQNAVAVEFRTHWHNTQSRAAITRLGAKQDGILRNHKIHPNGELRDTVIFSIIASEWPVVSKSLRYKLTQY